jgi:hypothetical protein
MVNSWIYWVEVVEVAEVEKVVISDNSGGGYE